MSISFFKKIIGGSNSIPLLQTSYIAFFIFAIYMAVVIIFCNLFLWAAAVTTGTLVIPDARYPHYTPRSSGPKRSIPPR